MPGRFAAAVVGLLLAGLGPEAAASDPGPPEGQRPRPRLALVLSGGGARGIAHIGALRALEEAGIPVDAIAANSMGAVVGGIYATGRTAEELDEIVLSVDWRSLFSGRTDRRLVPVARRQDRFRTLAGADFTWKELKLGGGLLGEHRVNRFLIEELAPGSYAAEGDFDRLPIPFRCVATDLDKGERVVLADGDLALAVRASMSIPVAFPPVEWRGRRLVDGLVVDNLPTDVAREFGAAVVVAVDIGSPPLKPEDYESSLGVAEQLMNLLTERRNADFAAEADVLIRPDLGTHGASEYSGFGVLIEKGYEATKAALPQIRKALAAAGIEGEMEPRTRPAPERQLEGTPIAEVRARGNDRLSERVLRRTFNIPIGPGFILQRGLRAFDKIEATGLLRHAWIEFEPVPEGLRITLVVREAPPNRAEIGAAFSEWEKARGVVRLFNRNTFGFGEELSLLLVASEADVGGKLSLRGEMPFFYRLAYRADAFSISDKPRFFDDQGAKIARADFNRSGVDLALQAPVERWGLLEAGFRLGQVSTRKKAGIDLPEDEDSVRTFFAGLVVDRLDRLLWPESGQRLAVVGWWNADEMGATRPFWRVEGEGRLGQRFGKKAVLQLDALVGLSGKDLPVYDWFRIGGPYLIPGYHHEELKGPQALAGAVSFRYCVVGQLQAVGRVGIGNVYGSRTDITLDDLRWGVGIGLVFQSRVGPLAFELGWRDGGASLFTGSLGWN
jgi:NTE family protein